MFSRWLHYLLSEVSGYKYMCSEDYTCVCVFLWVLLLFYFHVATSSGGEGKACGVIYIVDIDGRRNSDNNNNNNNISRRYYPSALLPFLRGKRVIVYVFRRQMLMLLRSVGLFCFYPFHVQHLVWGSSGWRSTSTSTSVNGG